MKKILSLTIATTLALSLCACSSTPPKSSSAPSQTGASANSSVSASASSTPTSSESETAPSIEIIPGVNAENYPVVDGSTANMPLMAKIYSEVCGVSVEDAETMINITTTGPSWSAITNKQADLLMVYEPSEEVRKEVEASPTKLEITPIGKDALVFLANTNNKVSSLTQQQIIDIYTGKTTDWSALDGDKGPIAAFQRDPNSGSQTLFMKLLMKNNKLMPAPTELVPAAMGALIDGIADYDGTGGAIGYSVFYYAKEMYTKPNLKLLSVDNIAPTADTIGDGSYPLTNDFYVVIRADEPQNSPARLLRDWMLTSQGNQALIDAGYVAIK